MSVQLLERRMRRRRPTHERPASPPAGAGQHGPAPLSVARGPGGRPARQGGLPERGREVVAVIEFLVLEQRMMFCDKKSNKT
jgi:hypothetical protein